jgi:hypothetical protein
VISTNHGSATNVIELPVRETTSATITPARDRFRTTPTERIIKRTYGFVT